MIKTCKIHCYVLSTPLFSRDERNTVLEMPCAALLTHVSWFSSLEMCVCIFHTTGGAFQLPLAWNPLQYFQVSASQLNKGDSSGNLKSVSFQYSSKSRSYHVIHERNSCCWSKAGTSCRDSAVSCWLSLMGTDLCPSGIISIFKLLCAELH